jgi:membrane glycosyltransferase
MDTVNTVSATARSWRVTLRRVMFFGLTVLSSGAATALLVDVLAANGVSAIELVGLLLFFGLFTWIAGALWTAIAGFFVELAGHDREGIDLAALEGRKLRTRTAVVMPIYNEDTLRVEAGLDATWQSLAAQPDSTAFDLFILSDTTDADIAREEEAMWQRFAARHDAAGRVFYRRRIERSGRKAGNVLDFVDRWGANYECMIVLDADSVMSGHCLVTLARAMEARPQLGILQSLPLAMGRESLFARLIQFGSRLQSQMLCCGLAYWQVGDSNYWGHNAIIRIKPFSQFGRLPKLSGRPPLGGEILSHDFVEAAFMRRAGYEIRVLPQLVGSWEEVPANVLDYAARDRRWTQGNLQHARVFFFPGLRPLSRVHLLTGIVSYVSSPMWLALLLLSSVLSAIEAGKRPQYFLPGLHSLPNWPVVRSGEISVLLLVTLVVLLLPKVLGAILAIGNRDARRQYGGAGHLLLGLFVEQLFSMLLAPSMMLFHSTFVTQTLLGRSVSWDAQVRTDRGVTVREALRRQKWHLVFGLVWGLVMLQIAPQFFWWLTPVLLGLVCSVWLTAWTSRISAGAWFRRRRLLLTPEETEPPPELLALHQAELEPPPSAPALPAGEAVGGAEGQPPAATPNAETIDNKETIHEAQSWIPDRRRAAAGGHPGVGGRI